jgi:hypothetical protein
VVNVSNSMLVFFPFWFAPKGFGANQKGKKRVGGVAFYPGQRSLRFLAQGYYQAAPPGLRITAAVNLICSAIPITTPEATSPPQCGFSHHLWTRRAAGSSPRPDREGAEPGEQGRPGEGWKRKGAAGEGSP